MSRDRRLAGDDLAYIRALALDCSRTGVRPDRWRAGEEIAARLGIDLDSLVIDALDRMDAHRDWRSEFDR